MLTLDNEYWMKFALLEARKAAKKNEVPVGAILVWNNELIASAYNKPITHSDPTSHAEINVIRKASKIIKNYRLKDFSLYVTLEPCLMCYGAIIHSRISNVFFGAKDYKTGVCGSCLNLEDNNCTNHKPNIMGGILERECSAVISDFFKVRRI